MPTGFSGGTPWHRKTHGTTIYHVLWAPCLGETDSVHQTGNSSCGGEKGLFSLNMPLQRLYHLGVEACLRLLTRCVVFLLMILWHLFPLGHVLEVI